MYYYNFVSIGPLLGKNVFVPMSISWRGIRKARDLPVHTKKKKQ